MNIVLLQARLSLEEIDLLLKEFPQYLFLSLSEASYKNLSQEHWSRVEIIYGNKLTPEDLEKAHQLRWIHSPQTLLNRICLPEIEKIHRNHQCGVKIGKGIGLILMLFAMYRITLLASQMI